MTRRWRDTPKGQQVFAERLDGERVRFAELRTNEIFRAVAPNGEYVDPISHEENSGWFRVVELPFKADGLQCLLDYGYAVVVEPVDDPKASLN